MKKRFFFLVLAGALLIPSLAFAMTIKTDEDEVVLADAIRDDAFIAGGKVSLNQPITGDLITFGGGIGINGTVGQDLNAAGGTIILNTDVGDDARLAGGTIQVASRIQDDLMIGGGDVQITKSAEVGGDLYVGAGTLLLEGKINGNVKGAVSLLQLKGEVAGNVDLQNVDRVEFGSDAKIRGNLTYRSRTEIKNLPAGAVGGKIEFKEMIGRGPKGDHRNWPFYSLLSMLFAGLFVIWIWRYYLINLKDKVLKKPLKSAGLGALMIVGGPVLFGLLMATFIGIPLALITFATYLITLYFGALAASALIGFKLLKTSTKNGFWAIYGAFALGALIYNLLGLIPFIGWLAKLILLLMGLGGIVILEISLMQELRKKKMI